MNIFFFRNDDVRDNLDQSLVDITDIFIKNEIPITHAVEPANLTPEVVAWLIEVKKSYPELIGIMQHGYDHKVKNKHKKGEFGGQRSYEEQYQEIWKGRELMDIYFGDVWFPAFNFPYAPYNRASIRALDDLGYKVLNSHYNIDWKRRIFYFLGHLLGRGLLLNHHVSWNMNKYPGTSMYEISMSISFIKRYINEETDCELYSYEDLCSQIDRYMLCPYPVGLLLHHRYHTAQDSVVLISRVIDYLESKGAAAVSMEDIYQRLENENKK